MIPNPWILLGVVLAWIASLGAVGFWQNTAGHVAERVSWQAKDNAELKAANAEITRLNDAARAKEETQAAQFAVIAAQHEKDTQDAEDQRRRDVDAARTGALKLRVPGACPAGGGATGQASTAAGGGDGRTTGELPPAVTADLFGLADDADAVVKQLDLCQTTIKSYIQGVAP